MSISLIICDVYVIHIILDFCLLVISVPEEKSVKVFGYNYRIINYRIFCFLSD